MSVSTFTHNPFTRLDTGHRVGMNGVSHYAALQYAKTRKSEWVSLATSASRAYAYGLVARLYAGKVYGFKGADATFTEFHGTYTVLVRFS